MTKTDQQPKKHHHKWRVNQARNGYRCSDSECEATSPMTPIIPWTNDRPGSPATWLPCPGCGQDRIIWPMDGWVCEPCAGVRRFLAGTLSTGIRAAARVAA